MNRKRSARNAYIIMTCMAIVFILPLLWVIFASFNPDAGVGLKFRKRVIQNRHGEFSFVIGMCWVDYSTRMGN